MTQPLNGIKTLSEMRIEQSFRRVPKLLGGQKDKDTETLIDGISGVLKIVVRYSEFKQIKEGLLNDIIRKKCVYWNQRLVNRNYHLVMICEGNPGGARLFCEYEGYFISQSNHFLKTEKLSREAKEGDFVLKIGLVLKFVNV